MQIYQINTTAFKEEDLFLLTDLTEDQITEVVNPLVMAERDGYEEYNNEILVEALEKRFPKNNIKMFSDFVYLSY
jgi:hypothetical protein